MSMFNEAIAILGATIYTIYSVKKEDNSKENKVVYGVFINMPAKSMSDRKDLVSEGYTNSFFTDFFIDDKEYKNYLFHNGKYYYLVLQGDLYQKPNGQTLNHYEYICREATNEFEDITT